MILSVSPEEPLLAECHGRVPDVLTSKDGPVGTSGK